jgi:hypothetical protein
MKNTLILLLALVGNVAMAQSFTPQQQGCCSFHSGESGRCAISGHEICNDGTESPTCLCTYTPPPPPTPILPIEGMWWSPAESGTGYAIDVKHGVLVMTVYSYNTDGSPQWYLLIGTIINNTTTGPLLKFRNGPCIACAYQNPVADGDDGSMTVTFNSPTLATLLLPEGRLIQIIPQVF